MSKVLLKKGLEKLQETPGWLQTDVTVSSSGPARADLQLFSGWAISGGSETLGFIHDFHVSAQCILILESTTRDHAGGLEVQS